MRKKPFYALCVLSVLAATFAFLPYVSAQGNMEDSEEEIWVEPSGLFALYCKKPGAETLFNFTVDTVMGRILSPENATLLELTEEKIVIRQENADTGKSAIDYHFNMLTGEMFMQPVDNGANTALMRNELSGAQYYCVQEEMRF